MRLFSVIGSLAMVCAVLSAGAIAAPAGYEGSAKLRRLRRSGAPVSVRGAAQATFDEETGSFDLTVTALGDAGA